MKGLVQKLNTFGAMKKRKVEHSFECPTLSVCFYRTYPLQGSHGR